MNLKDLNMTAKVMILVDGILTLALLIILIVLVTSNANKGSQIDSLKAEVTKLQTEATKRDGELSNCKTQAKQSEEFIQNLSQILSSGVKSNYLGKDLDINKLRECYKS